MRTNQTILLLACFIFALTSTAYALPLANRHQLELRLGYWNQSTDTRTYIGAGTVRTTVGSSGGLGGLSYGYWFAENAALNISACGLFGDVKSVVSTTGVEESHAVVAPLFAGLKFYPFQWGTEAAARPFIKAAAGPIVGAQQSARIDTMILAEERTQTVFGGQIAGGVDIILGRHAMAGFAFGYNMMSDFDEPIGGSANYSGPEFSFGVSLLFGGGE